MSASIRHATLADGRALVRLAGRDSTDAPAGTVLLAEEAGEVRAALELETGRVVADPFVPTAHLVAALRAIAVPRERRSGRTPRARLLELRG